MGDIMRDEATADEGVGDKTACGQSGRRAGRYLWLASPAATLRLNSAEPLRGTLSVCQWSPAEMLRQQNDLADVMRIVGELAIDGLHHGVLFAANGDGAGQVGVGERLQRGEEAGPARFPHRQEFGARCGRLFEFAVAIAVGLLAVGGEEVGPARAHVAGHVLHDGRNGIAFVIERGDRAARRKPDPWRVRRASCSKRRAARESSMYDVVNSSAMEKV